MRDEGEMSENRNREFLSVLNFAPVLEERDRDLTRRRLRETRARMGKNRRLADGYSSENIKLIDRHKSRNVNLFGLRSLVPSKVKSQHARTSS